MSLLFGLFWPPPKACLGYGEIPPNNTQLWVYKCVRAAWYPPACKRHFGRYIQVSDAIIAHQKEECRNKHAEGKGISWPFALALNIFCHFVGHTMDAHWTPWPIEQTKRVDDKSTIKKTTTKASVLAINQTVWSGVKVYYRWMIWYMGHGHGPTTKQRNKGADAQWPRENIQDASLLGSFVCIYKQTNS